MKDNKVCTLHPRSPYTLGMIRTVAVGLVWICAFGGAPIVTAQITSIVSGNELIVIGTDGDDTITITCNSGQVKINGNDPSTGSFDCNLLQKITIDAGDGEDDIDLSGVSGAPTGFPGLLETSTMMGIGNDTFTGSPFPDLVSGGPGNDGGTTGDGNDQVLYEWENDFDTFNLGSGDDLAIFIGTPLDDAINLSNDGLPFNTFFVFSDASNGIEATNAERIQIEPLPGDTDMFFFLDPCNIEMLVKLLDNSLAPSGHTWVFFAASTNVEYSITVTDTDASAVNTFFNPLSTPSPPVTDMAAFATCPGASAKTETGTMPGVQFFIANTQNLTFNTGGADDLIQTIGLPGVTQAIDAGGNPGSASKAKAGDELIVDAKNQNATDNGSTIQIEGAGPINYANVETVTLQNVIPVELVSFEAVRDEADVLLSWATASETNNAGFEVQHRANADDRSTWEVLGWVEGHGTTTVPQHYRYRVENLPPGLHRFRLKQIDFDGAFEHSPEVEVLAEVPGAFVLGAAYPNPFNPRATFTIAVREKQQVRLTVYDALGHVVAVLNDGFLEPHRAYTFTIDGLGWASGLYFYEALGEDFRAVRSVMLLK